LVMLAASTYLVLRKWKCILDFRFTILELNVVA
jgi:hypothetical protein